MFQGINFIRVFFIQEQVNKIRSYENRVNNAKENYTKALQRLEELNNKIYDQTNVACFVDDQKCSSNIDDTLSEDNVEYQSIEILPKKTISKQANKNDDDTIFDHPTLDQLVLEDDLDSNLDRLKNECLSQEKSKNT